jgi:hypothetical protein
MTTPPTTPPTATPSTRATPPSRRPWSAGRTVLVIAGSLLTLVALATLAGGGVALWADQQRGSDGYFTAGPGRFSTDTQAIAVHSVHVQVSGPDTLTGLYDQDSLGDLRIQLRSDDPDASLFVGVGPADDVAAYLDPVTHDEVANFDTGPFQVDYSRHDGGQTVADPAAQTFWAASDAGPGPRTLTWPVTSGDWAVVIMNTDTSAGVRAEVTTGATMPILGTAAVIALTTGGLLLVGGVVMIVAPITTRRPRRSGVE